MFWRRLALLAVLAPGSRSRPKHSSGETSSALGSRRRRTSTAGSTSAAWSIKVPGFVVAEEAGPPDYPRADINMSIRLAELTRTDVSFSARGQPNHLLVRLTDDTLFQCPFLMMAAPGSAFFTDIEAERLREYLLKGGLPVGRRLLGQLPVGAVGVTVSEGAAALRVRDR